MQADTGLVAAERRFIDRADEIIVLADASKCDAPVVCGLDEIDVLISNASLSADTRAMLEGAGVRVVDAAMKVWSLNTQAADNLVILP
jgi:DeoR family ulaG and ulaABCDEF operon transcriptional repressor